ncbi:hypothetical protein KAH37_02820, partial [bacterium]|nr:hypothetical protein [bacterium]
MSKPLSLILWIAGLVVVIFLAWHIFVSITIQQEVDEKISELSNIALISYNKCRVNSFDRSVTLSNLIITLVDTRQPFSIEKVTWKEGDLRVKNLIFDIDKAGSRANYLRQLGYHGKIPVSFSLQSAWNQNRTTLHAQLHITMQDIATLVVNGHFNRIPFFD